MTTEGSEQAAYFDFVRLKAKQDIRYKLIHSTLNGAWLRGGPVGWAKLVKQGAAKGIPDIWCYLPIQNSLGFVAEFKSAKKKATQEQAQWLSTMQVLGWSAFIFRSANTAIKHTEKWVAKCTLTTEQIKELRILWN